MAKQRIFYTVDPLDEWVRITVVAERYSEPPTSLHDFVKAAGLTVKWRGAIPYINVRHYQNAIEALPEEKPKKEETGQTVDPKEKAKKGGDEKNRRRRNVREAPVGEGAVPGVAGGRTSVRAQLRLEEGGL